MSSHQIPGTQTLAVDTGEEDISDTELIGLCRRLLSCWGEEVTGCESLAASWDMTGGGLEEDRWEEMMALPEHVMAGDGTRGDPATEAGHTHRVNTMESAHQEMFLCPS